MEDNHKTNLFTYLTVFTVDILGLCLGMTSSWSSPVVYKLKDANNTDNPLGYQISSEESSWIGSLNSLGCAIGPLLFGYLAAIIGRKFTLIIVGSLYLFQFFVLAFAKNIVLYYVCRVIGGFAEAGTFTTVPTYVAEIAHHKERAKLNTGVTAMAFLGLFVCYAIGPYMPLMYFNLTCGVFPLFFVVVFTIFMPETPHFLAAKQKGAELRKSLCKFRNKSPENLEEEAKDIEEFAMTNDEGSIRDFVRKRFLFVCLLLAITMNVFQQLAGLTALINYAQDIFKAAGSSLSSDVSAIIYSLVQSLIGFGAPFVMPRFKYKTLLIWSNAGLITFHTIFGIYFYLKDHSDVDVSSFGWLPIVLMIGIVFSFLYGVGNATILVVSEIFPTNLRSLAISIGLMFGSTVSFLNTRFYAAISDSLGYYGTSWIYAVSCAVGLVFDIFFVPDTNGKSFQEIQDIIRRRKPSEKKMPS